MRGSFVGFQLLLVAGLALGGCTGHLNQEDDLLGSPLPDLAGPMPNPNPETPELKPTAGDRSAWQPTVVVVERRQVEVQPWYVTQMSLDREFVGASEGGTARSRNEFPTKQSALELEGDGGRVALLGVYAPVAAVGDWLLMPIRFFAAPPGTTVRVPAEPPPLRPTALSTTPAPAAP